MLCIVSFRHCEKGADIEMNLIYEILWFEDEEDVVKESIGEAIIEYLLSLGYRPNIVHEKNGRNLNALLECKNYDLIISDLNLGDSETGDILVEKIRTQSIFTEVLLYSAVASDIRKIIDRNGMIERISFSVGLDNLIRKIKNIIDLTLKKVQDVNNMRGLVIAETIDLEIIIEECTHIYFETESIGDLQTKKALLLEEIMHNKRDRCCTLLERIDNFKELTIVELIEHDVITMYDLYVALQSILKSNIKDINIRLENKELDKNEKEVLNSDKKRIESLKKKLNTFNEDIIKLRNTLAHVQEKKDAQGVPYLESINKNGLRILFDDNKYSEIRIALNEHHDNLILIKKMIESYLVHNQEVAAVLDK